MKSKILAAKKTALAVALATGFITTTTAPVQAGIPVIDGGNLAQNIMTAIESVAQTLKQIEQYQTQLQQYENQLQNTMAPAAYIWDQAQTTINRLIAAQNTLAYYENQLGSLDRYLAKFQDVAYYRSSPCFNGSGGCTPAEKAAMEENRRLASESQKKANDALFQTVADCPASIRFAGRRHLEMPLFTPPRAASRATLSVLRRQRWRGSFRHSSDRVRRCGGRHDPRLRASSSGL